MHGSTPFYCQVGIALIGLLIALLLIEPKVHRLEEGKSKPCKNIKKIIHYAIVENNILRAYIFYSTILCNEASSAAMITMLKDESKAKAWLEDSGLSCVYMDSEEKIGSVGLNSKN